jgi:predicted dehydrogenase
VTAPPLRVALLGAGWIMDFHASAVAEHPGAELVAAANWRTPSLVRLAERHGIPRTTTDWRGLVTDPEVDAVVIGTPNALHAEQAIACLQAGKHVLVEKPMTRNLAEADAVLAAAARSGARLMVAHCWRFHLDVRALRRRVAAGELGEVVKTRGYGAHVNWGPSGWFTDPALAGGGALLDMGVHAIDTARFVLGDPLPARVCATAATRYRDDAAVDDDAVLLVSWSNGTNSIIEAGWWQPHAGGLEADTEVYGTRGYARIWERTGQPEGYQHCGQPMYSAQMAEFVEALAAGRQPRPSGEDGRVVMRVVQEAYASARASRRSGPDSPWRSAAAQDTPDQSAAPAG